MSTTTEYDAIVIGGGHNGLVNGAYLARAGLRTLILERRHLVGGAAITEELRPGFKFTTFSYALSLLRPDIIHELDLVRHGFMPLLMPSTFCPMENGDSLVMGQDRNENINEISRHSQPRCRRLRPVQPRHHDGHPRRQAAVRLGAAEPLGREPRRVSPSWPRWRSTCAASTRRCCTIWCGCSPAAPPTSSTTTSRATSSRAGSRRRRSSARRSARCRRARVSCCCSTAWASTTVSSVRGRSTRVATAGSPRCSGGRRRHSAPRSS